MDTVKINETILRIATETNNLMADFSRAIVDVLHHVDTVQEAREILEFYSPARDICGQICGCAEKAQRLKSELAAKAEKTIANAPKR